MCTKPKVYLVCDYTDPKAAEIKDCPDVGVEFLGRCTGRILWEDGSEIGRHNSSSFGWLRADLLGKLKEPTSEYEIVDLIGLPVPEQFQLERRGGSFDIEDPDHCNMAGDVFTDTGPAVDRLRLKAQNEQTVFGLSRLLTETEKERDLYKKRLDGLRELCGFVENGSDITVTICQDDATYDWVVASGNIRGYGRSMVGALDEAIGLSEKADVVHQESRIHRHSIAEHMASPPATIEFTTTKILDFELEERLRQKRIDAQEAERELKESQRGDRCNPNMTED